VTYPDAEVAAYIGERMVAYEADMADKQAQPLFRANHVIWTPAIGVGDRNGSLHYTMQGFLPPAEFLSALRIGRARALMAWTRHKEAAGELEAAVEAGDSFAAEAMFWLATAHYFERRDSGRMYEVWERLVELYPESPWAKRTYPRSGE
jgi:hypothetical protein